jgi:hypothetical protein
MNTGGKTNAKPSARDDRMTIHKMSGNYQGWALEGITVSAVQSQVAQIVAEKGWDNSPFSDNMSIQDKFIIVLEALDELGHLLSADIVTTHAIMRQTFKIAALAAMFGESLELDSAG